jgi:surfeit locus 1 family protein
MVYRFATRPRWVVGHVLVAIAVVVMVNLGLWQLRRLDERRDANDRILDRAVAPVLALDTAEHVTATDVDDLEFRRVEATGRFDPSHEVFVGYRSRNGLPGYHVVTPFIVADGEAVLVNRGFVPVDAERWAVNEYAAPSGETTIVGLARRGIPSRGDPRQTPTGVPTFTNVDIAAIDRYIPANLLPIQLELQESASADFPEPLPPLDVSDGPHLSYAVQWFSFSAIAIVGWIALLRRAASRSTGRGGPALSTPAETILERHL